MSIGHLFRPRWKHPNWKIRLRAVEKLNCRKSSAVLGAVAENDNEPHVRKAAVQKLRENDFVHLLADIAITDSDPGVRLAAVEKLVEGNRVEVLCGIAKNDTAPSVRKKVVELLGAMLSENAVAENNPQTLQKCLNTVASEDSNPEVRSSAFPFVDDIVLLTQIANKDPDTAARKKARKIQQEMILSKASWNKEPHGTFSCPRCGQHTLEIRDKWRKHCTNCGYHEGPGYGMICGR